MAWQSSAFKDCEMWQILLFVENVGEPRWLTELFHVYFGLELFLYIFSYKTFLVFLNKIKLLHKKELISKMEWKFIVWENQYGRDDVMDPRSIG